MLIISDDPSLPPPPPWSWSRSRLTRKRADNRPGLVAALEAACRAKAVLVVYSLSRMSRSVTDTLAIVARLDKAGAGFVSLTESIDTTTADGAPRRDSQ